ncbi:MAG: dual specificity protein phosphatase family protein [Planctomycetota bacterium]|nr:dual specificity protein phosphatase family protein [Planctomycetota bacterium]
MALFSYLFFYPTLWWNLLLNRVCARRRWWDWVDDSVLLGAAPLRRHVAELKQAGIGAVVNTCREWRGPVEAYRAAGIEELYLPITDFTAPRLNEVRAAVRFIEQQIAAGRKVYVHCKAGRGRSATIVLCYLIAKGFSPEKGQALLLEKRPHVNRGLAQREVVRQFAAEYRDSETRQAKG